MNDLLSLSSGIILGIAIIIIAGMLVAFGAEVKRGNIIEECMEYGKLTASSCELHISRI